MGRISAAPLFSRGESYSFVHPLWPAIADNPAKGIREVSSMDSARGFLPAKDPLARLPPEFKFWDKLAYDLPKLLATTRIRTELAQLPKFSVSKLKTEAQLERAMMIFSY